MPDITLCEGEKYEVDNFNFEAFESGVYKQKLVSVTGCDSTVILNVTVNPILRSDEVATICQGAYYEFNSNKYYTSIEKTDTLQSLVTGCDSIVTLHLTVNEILKGETEVVYLCPDVTYYLSENYPAISEEGIYSDVVVNALGCDSVASVEIRKAEPAQTLIRAAICQGEVYNEGIFGGLRQAGTYSTPQGTLFTEHGCDSIVTLELLVAVDGELADTISEQELPYILNGVELFDENTPVGVHTATVNLGCGEVTLVLVVGDVTALNNVYVNSVAIAPNPAKVGEQIRVLSSFTTDQLSRMAIDVYSASGMLVSRQKPTTSPVVIEPIHSAGIYMVVMTSGNSTWQAKLVVE
ncbi:MAG: T9SS type A sorting domain-containing protein [Paludibacteraceae bacterium]|nr:T9SS type A sorting domain-containing protein [Paludibacteraceae bacterium]